MSTSVDDLDDDLDDDDLEELLDGDARGETFQAAAPARPMVVSQHPDGSVVLAGGRATPSARQAARRVPLFATTGTGLAGLSAWGLAEAVSVVDPAAGGAVILGTWVATGVGLPALRFRLRDRTLPDGCSLPDGGTVVQRIPRSYRRRWWTAGGLAALWIDAMAAGAVHSIGPEAMGAILLGGAGLLSLRWMRDHAIELPTDTPLPAPAPAAPPAAIEQPPPPLPRKFPTPPPPDEGDIIAELWATRVAAGPNAIAPGATLGDDRVDLPYGYRWVVQLNPVGGISCTTLCGRAEDLALPLELNNTHVMIDPLEGDGARADRALLTVVTKDVLRDGVPYRGPVYQDGRIPLGPYADGSGYPDWVARDDTGPQHGMVTGGTRSGKSELLARLGMALRYSGEWIVLFGDGDEQGRSSPLLKRIAYDFAKGPAEVLEQLEALEAWFQARGSVMGGLTEDGDGKPVPMTDPARQEPAKKIVPCRAFPGFVWIIDEFHRLAKALDSSFVERVAKLVRIIGKAGGAVYLGTQSSLMEDFGGDDVLRGQLAAGNCVIMRTKNRTEANVVADFGGDPSTLPKGGGYGLVDDDGRSAMFRGEYSPDMARWARALPQYRPDELPARVYASKRPPKPADPIADYKEAQEQTAAILAALDSGERLPWEPEPLTEPGAQPAPPTGQDSVATPAPAPAPAGSDPSHWTMGGVGVPEATVGPALLAVQAHPAPAGSAAAPPAQDPQRQTDAGLHRKSQLILDVLLSDPARTWTSAELAQAAELAGSDVATFGRPLLERGLAHRPTAKTGYWRAGPGPSGQAGTAS